MFGCMVTRRGEHSSPVLLL